MVESPFRPVGAKPCFDRATLFCCGLDGNAELGRSLSNFGAPYARNVTEASRFDAPRRRVR